MPILVTRSSMPPWEEYVAEIKSVFESRYLTNLGPVHQKFQQQLEEYLGVPHVSLFTNGHLALENAIQALGLRDTGGEVITTPFTFVSTVNAIVRNGLTPVFCDIREEDYTLDPEKLERLITDRTVAILPVHVYGNVCQVEHIQEIADRHGLKVIYDAAHAFGVTCGGTGVANFGDAAVFSFHATKVFHTVEGGAVAFRDPKYREKLDELKNFGLHGEDVPEAGGNAKMDEFRAAMGVCNLRRINECIARRGEAAARYWERLGGVPGLRLNRGRADATENFAYFPVLFDPAVFGKSRDEVAESLAAHDIYARKYFYPAVNEMSFYRDRFPGETPVARRISEQVLCLPLFEELTRDDVDRICDIILN